MFCKSCGRELKEGERFCIRCGSSVAEPETGAKEEKKPASVKEAAKRKPKPEKMRKTAAAESGAIKKRPASQAPARAGRIGAGYRLLIFLLLILIGAGTATSLWFLGGAEWLREVLLLP